MSETQNQKGYALSLEHLSHERIEVSNAEFLHEAFAVSAAHCGDCRPVTVSFAGDPARDARWLANLSRVMTHPSPLGRTITSLSRRSKRIRRAFFIDEKTPLSVSSS